MPADARERVRELVAGLADELIEVSHRIHEHPELNFGEHYAHDVLCASLEAHGLAVERSAYGVETAFEARAGERGPTIAVLCEYDALPGIGHACGHNVIAAAGLGAGLAAAALAPEYGGRVRILGTPAEEGGGGKIVLARRGAFEGIDAAMMVHPADADLVRMDTVALRQMTVKYHGRAAHAAAAPWDGLNALDAAVLGYMNVAALRQHIRPTERVHGVIRNGGDKANIVPAFTELEWIVRAATIGDLEALIARVVACLESAAVASGCTVEILHDPVTYADMIDNPVMVERYARNAAVLGRTVVDPAEAHGPVIGSTDMGNISHLVPSIHPMIKVAADGVAIHTERFAHEACGPGGDQAVLDGAAAMAMTVLDLWTGALEPARAAFESVERDDRVLR